MSILTISGPMGSGKTTIGGEIAERLESPFVDLDDHITENCLPEGKSSIAEIVGDGSGMSDFRPIETEALEKLLGTDTGVISLGGGAVTIAKNVEMIQERAGKIILLRPPFEECWKRVTEDKKGNGKRMDLDKGKFERLYNDRKDIYYETADIVVTTVGKVEEITDEVLGKLASEEIIDVLSDTEEYLYRLVRTELLGNALSEAERIITKPVWDNIGVIVSGYGLTDDENLHLVFQSIVSFMREEVLEEDGEVFGERIVAA